MSNPNLSAYVADHLRACQLKQLSILEEVDRICKKHGIGYWLDGGSLLGAVRHGGCVAALWGPSNIRGSFPGTTILI